MTSQVTSRHHTFKMAAPLDVRMKQRTVIEFLTAEEIPPVDIQRCLKNIDDDDSTIDVSIVRH